MWWSTGRTEIFRAAAIEKHNWDFAVSSEKPEKEFHFTVLGDLPKAPSRSRTFAGAYVHVKYTVTTPGNPHVTESDLTFPIRFNDTKEGISRCLRLEQMNGGKQLRVGMLPNCKMRFEDLQPTITIEGTSKPQKDKKQ